MGRFACCNSNQEVPCCRKAQIPPLLFGGFVVILFIFLVIGGQPWVVSLSKNAAGQQVKVTWDTRDPGVTLPAFPDG